MDEIERVIEERIRPILNADGGDIELLEVTEEGVVRVKLHGACATCPGAQQTLAEVVETALKEEFPDIKGVVAECQVSDELIGQALDLLRKGKLPRAEG